MFLKASKGFECCQSKSATTRLSLSFSLSLALVSHSLALKAISLNHKHWQPIRQCAALKNFPQLEMQWSSSRPNPPRHRQSSVKILATGS